MERGGQELEEAGDDGCEGALLRKLSWNDMEAWTEFVQASCYTGKEDVAFQATLTNDLSVIVIYSRT